MVRRGQERSYERSPSVQAISPAERQSVTAENIEKSGRFTALDGLRGLAAMVVVVPQALRTNPAFGSLEGQLGPGDWSWWLLNTPFRLVWAGPEAVLVFFVLSGFVLTLAALRASAGFWRAYYPQRLIRLYLPVWGALVATLVLAWAIPRNAAIGDSVWLASSDVAATRRTLLKDFTLTNPSLLDGPLWSLRI